MRSCDVLDCYSAENTLGMFHTLHSFAMWLAENYPLRLEFRQFIAKHLFADCVTKSMSTHCKIKLKMIFAIFHTCNAKQNMKDLFRFVVMLYTISIKRWMHDNIYTSKHYQKYRGSGLHNIKLILFSTAFYLYNFCILNEYCVLYSQFVYKE